MKTLMMMISTTCRTAWAFWLGLLLTPALAQSQDQVVYYHTDAIGSVRAISDDTGTVIGRYDYFPFGEPWPGVPPPPTEVRQFGGKERDSESGLDYFGARYYRGVSGRFTTVDPVLNIEAAVADPQRWNRYAYAANNPMKFTDPDGRDPRLAVGLLGAVTYAAWNGYLNTQQGRPWYENIGVEASKGFVVGITLGLAGPALGAAGLETVGAAAAGGGAATATTAGRWIQVAESMSGRAAAYQAQITGRAGQAFVVNGVKFDGFANGVLQEAKGPGYAAFVKDGAFQPWFRGAADLVSQAQRQLSAAGGARIHWYFAEESAANATRALFKARQIQGIDIIYR